MKNQTHKNVEQITVSDMVDIVKSFDFDPLLKYYHKDITTDVYEKNWFLLANQYLYFFDFFTKKLVQLNRNITRILGYEKNELDFTRLYELVHPADRLSVYLATIKSIYYANSKFNARAYDDVFSMDFRIKTKNGEYRRILRHTGAAVYDKSSNMVVSFALNTDITNLKTGNYISFGYVGKSRNIEFPDNELVKMCDVFTAREKTILYHLCKGKTSTQISEILFISKHTVDTHRRNMLNKAMLKNTPELITYGIENCIV